jgi:hypothetical protein
MTTTQPPAPAAPRPTAPTDAPSGAGAATSRAPSQRTYRRNTWQEAVAEYLPARRRTPKAFRWIERLPLIAVLTVLVLFAVRLRNGAMIDEALYINLGNQYLGGPPPTRSDTDFISGAPFLYPVLAAALDGIGGLWLVRLASLAAVVVAVVALERAVIGLEASRRAGIMAALAFAFVGPVVMVAMLATFDAVVVMLLALALMVATTRRGMGSAALVGGLLALAALTKYTAAPLALVVLVVLLVAGPAGLRRGAAAAGTALALLGLAWLRWGDLLGPGVAFTTTQRNALGPTPAALLLGSLLVTMGLLLALALAGALRPARPGLGRMRSIVLNLALLGGGLALPLGQVRLGEGVSFGKHLAYSALFLAPLAGRQLAAMSRGLLKLLPVGIVAAAALLVAWVRSDALYHEWVDVSPVAAAIEADPQPGTYLSSAADVLAYYTADEPALAWDTTFALYAEGEDEIVAAVREGRYRMVVLRTGTTGNPDQDLGQAVLLGALNASDDYRLGEPSAPIAPGSSDRWLVYTKE